MNTPLYVLTQRLTKVLFVTFIVSMVLAIGQSALADTASEALTEEDKREKRLQFNQYVEQAMAAQEAKQREKAAKEAQWLFIKGSASMGYHDNVALSPKRDGDMFHEEEGEVKLKFKHNGFLDWFGQGHYGVKAHTLFRDFSDHDDFDYHTLKLRPFFSAYLLNQYKLEAQYNLDLLRYIRNNQSNYVGHHGKLQITAPINKTLSQKAFFSYRSKDYIDRKVKSAENLPLEAERKDHQYEPGYGFLYYPSSKTVMNLQASWKFNESNDLHRDFNDYQGVNINGYWYQEFSDKLTGLVAGGYSYKDYENRTFSDSQSTQLGHYYYAAGYAYWSLSQSTQLVFKYLYGENNSNNPRSDYSFSTVTLGVDYKI